MALEPVMSLPQPWAWEVAYAAAPLINQKDPLPQNLADRRVWIASNIGVSWTKYWARRRWFEENVIGVDMPCRENLVRGHVLGAVWLEPWDEKQGKSVWFVGPHAWRVVRAEPLKVPAPVQNAKRFFKVNPKDFEEKAGSGDSSLDNELASPERWQEPCGVCFNRMVRSMCVTCRRQGAGRIDFEDHFVLGSALRP